jgi:hypothetical protein
MTRISRFVARIAVCFALGVSLPAAAQTAPDPVTPTGLAPVGSPGTPIPVFSIYQLPMNQAITVGTQGLLWGDVFEESTRDTMPAAAWMEDLQGNRYDFAITSASDSITTLSLESTFVGPGTYAFHFADDDADRYTGSLQFLRMFPTTPLATPAPEPATWAMMILGFGAVGMALRGRPKLRLAYA